METKKITIEVSPEAARVYEGASPELRRKLDALLSLRLTEVQESTRSLEEVISDLSRKARERGLTPEILDSILNDE
jgi:hypothetical protein